jgi:flagellin-like protein
MQKEGKMDKRGVSPLVATILLIALSVALGAAVMSWGEDYIEEKAEFVQGVQETITTCDVVSFSVIQVGGVQQFCQEDGLLKGLIDNGPDADIQDFHARIVAEKGLSVDESVLSQPLPRGSATPVSFAIGDVGAVQQVKLTPKIMSGGKESVCSRQALLVENVLSC